MFLFLFKMRLKDVFFKNVHIYYILEYNKRSIN